MATDSNASASQASSLASQAVPGVGEPLRVVLLYKRHAPNDEHVLKLLETALAQSGYRVWIDRDLTLGVEWAKEIDRQIRENEAA